MQVGYSGFTMLDEPMNLLDSNEPIDPLTLTRALVEIESTTYHEGEVGDFLEEFLCGREWAVEKTAVAQPAEGRQGGARWNVYAGPKTGEPDLVFSTHMDTVPPLPCVP